MTDDERDNVVTHPAVAALPPAFGGPPLGPPPDLDPLMERYAAARTEREAADQVAKRLKVRELEVEAELFDAIERHNLRAAVHREFGRFALNDMATASVVDEEKARAWADAKYPELLTLNRQRLGKVVRDFFKGEFAEMPDGIEVRALRGIKWTRST